MTDPATQGMPAVTIATGSPNGDRYEVTIAQTGADTASIDMQRWAAGADPSADPDGDSYDLTEIRTTADGITCRGPWVLWAYVGVTLSLSAPGAPPALTVAITHSLVKDGTTTYPLTAVQMTAFRAFLTVAKFPEGTT